MPATNRDSVGMKIIHWLISEIQVSLSPAPALFPTVPKAVTITSLAKWVEALVPRVLDPAADVGMAHFYIYANYLSEVPLPAWMSSSETAAVKAALVAASHAFAVLMNKRWEYNMAALACASSLSGAGLVGGTHAIAKNGWAFSDLADYNYPAACAIGLDCMVAGRLQTYEESVEGVVAHGFIAADDVRVSDTKTFIDDALNAFERYSCPFYIFHVPSEASISKNPMLGSGFWPDPVKDAKTAEAVTRGVHDVVKGAAGGGGGKAVPAEAKHG